MRTDSHSGPLCFGEFELDVAKGELRRNGRRIKLQPQPFKLLVLLTRRAGALVTREEIRSELWTEGTFVDFDQSVNFTIKQIRDALHDVADRPVYIETVPRRGYRFIAPVDPAGAPVRGQLPRNEGTTTIRLQKALWTNIAELRLAERRQRKYRIGAAVAILALLSLIVILILVK